MARKAKIIPVSINLKKQEKPLVLVAQTLFRTALLCMASAGLSLLVVQIYGFPVDEWPVVFASCGFTVLFSVLFMVLKFRFALPLLALGAALFVYFTEFVSNMTWFADFLLHGLDSRLLYTSQFATHSAWQMTLMLSSSSAPLFYGMIVCAALTAFIVAITSRARFTGTVLILTILIMLPAFGAEKATLVPAVGLLVVSMFGLYGIWASQDGVVVDMSRFVRMRQKIIGGLPAIRRGATSGLLCFLIAAAGLLTAEALFPPESTYDIMSSLQKLSAGLVERFDSFRYLFNTVEDSGYFPSAGGGISNSLGAGSLSLNTPSTSKTPVLEVTLDSNEHPVYLRGGIGVTFSENGADWDYGTTQREAELETLMESFYPEIYHSLFGRKTELVGINDMVGYQQVDVRYLARSPNVFMPSTPFYITGFRGDSGYTVSLDTIVQKNGSVAVSDTYSWEIMYPKMNFYFGVNYGLFTSSVIDEYPAAQNDFAFNLGENKDKYIVMVYTETPAWQDFVGGREYSSGVKSAAIGLGMLDYDGVTIDCTEYLDMNAQYEALVYDIYTQTDPNERANIQRLIREFEDYASIDSPANVTTVQNIVSFFKSRYTYSLTADNTSGDNTLLGNFLFETRSGHCALYASAMTLMLRELGLPARYVTGYAVSGAGTPTADERYSYQVLQRDLHAWVEVYFPHVGWLSFDPTPPLDEFFSELDAASSSGEGSETTIVSFSSREPLTSTPAETDPPETTTTTSPDPISSDVSGENSSGEAGFTLTEEQITLLAVGLFVCLMAVFAVLLMRSVVRQERRTLKKYAGVNSRREAHGLYVVILKLLRMEKFRAETGEPPEDFAKRVERGLHLQPGFAEVMAALEKLEFSREAISEVEYRLIGDYAGALYRRAVTEKRLPTRIIRRFIILKIF